MIFAQQGVGLFDLSLVFDNTGNILRCGDYYQIGLPFLGKKVALLHGRYIIFGIFNGSYHTGPFQAWIRLEQIVGLNLIKPTLVYFD